MGKMVLQWEAWAYGLGAALIGGGAGAVATGFAQVITDPAHSDVKHLITLMGVSFVVAGIIAAASYLAKSPLPPVVTTTQVEKTITPTGDGGLKVESTSKTSTDEAK